MLNDKPSILVMDFIFKQPLCPQQVRAKNNFSVPQAEANASATTEAPRASAASAGNAECCRDSDDFAFSTSRVSLFLWVISHIQGPSSDAS